MDERLHRSDERANESGEGNIVEYVRAPFASAISSKATAEGIVARPPEPMYDAAGKRIIFKLKTRDFFPSKQESKTIHKNDIL